MARRAGNLEGGGQIGVAAPAALVTRSIEGGRGIARAVLRVVRAVCLRVEVWIDRVRQRRLLAQLSERELRDIGLSRYDALYEWRKPFWKP